MLKRAPPSIEFLIAKCSRSKVCSRKRKSRQSLWHRLHPNLFLEQPIYPDHITYRLPLRIEIESAIQEPPPKKC